MAVEEVKAYKAVEGVKAYNRQDRSPVGMDNAHEMSANAFCVHLLCAHHTPLKEASMQIKTVLSVLGKDRKGIVATVATTLYECGANIDDIAQTILDDVFSMTMLLTIDESCCTFNQLQERLARDSQTLGLQITLQRADVFEFMHRV